MRDLLMGMTAFPAMKDVRFFFSRIETEIIYYLKTKEI